MEAEEDIRKFLIKETIRFLETRRNHPNAEKKWIKLVFQSFQEIAKFKDRVQPFKATKTKISIGGIVFNGNTATYNEPVSFFELGFVEENVGKFAEAWEIENWCLDTNEKAPIPSIKNHK